MTARAASAASVRAAEAAALAELVAHAVFRERGQVTLQAIGDRLSMSKERVRQIQTDALRKLRLAMRAPEDWRTA